MSLTLVYSDIKAILDGYTEGIKYELSYLMDEISDELVGSRNILGLYEVNSRVDEIKEQMSNELVSSMTALIQKFNNDMKNLINNSERDFRLSIRDLNKKR